LISEKGNKISRAPPEKLIPSSQIIFKNQKYRINTQDSTLKTEDSRLPATAKARCYLILDTTSSPQSLSQTDQNQDIHLLIDATLRK